MGSVGLGTVPRAEFELTGDTKSLSIQSDQRFFATGTGGMTTQHQRRAVNYGAFCLDLGYTFRATNTIDGTQNRRARLD